MNTTLIQKAIRTVGKICLATVKLIVIGIAAAAVIAGIVYCQEKADHYTSKSLSEDIVVHYYYNTGKYRVYNTKTDRYTARRLDWVSSVERQDTFSVFSRNDRRGYINTLDGSIIIPEQYEKAWVFSEGIAAAMKDGKIGFINSRNETVLPFEFEFANGISYVFRDGYCAMTDENKACGLIDLNGDWALAPQYDCIWTPSDNGLRLVSDNGKYGLLAQDLTFTFPIEYDHITMLEDGNMLMVKEGIQKKVAPDGTVLQDFVMDDSWTMKYPIGLEMFADEDYRGNMEHREKVIHAISDYICYEINYDHTSACGVVHAKTGEIIIPALYEYIRMTSEYLFVAEDLNDGTSILIDSSGRII